jgi:hypothetical protein
VSDAVRREVSTRFTKRTRRPPANYEESSSGEDSDGQPQTPPRKKKTRQNSKCDHWPNDHIYSIAGQKLTYEDLSWQQFLGGYLAATCLSKAADQPHMYAHLEILAEDMQSFTFQAVRAFHGVWLQEGEQGRVTWADTNTRDVLRRRFVWNPAIASTRGSQQQHGGRSMPTRGKAKSFSKNNPCAAY